MILHRFVTLIWVLVVMGGCFVAPGPVFAAEVDFLSDEFYEEESCGPGIIDPLEPVNRVVFQFNDKLYFWVMEPVARMYSHVVPRDLRSCIQSFFSNLAEPVRLINTLLQGRFSDAGQVFLRFAVNSTLGVYGLGDPAAREFSLSPVEASLSGTLATWGVGDGFYLVVPLHGPTTLRDFTGSVVDNLVMTPYYAWTDDLYVQSAIYGGKSTNNLSLHLGEYEKMKDVLFDPYIAFRNGYMQNRHQKSEFCHPGSY